MFLRCCIVLHNTCTIYYCSPYLCEIECDKLSLIKFWTHSLPLLFLSNSVGIKHHFIFAELKSHSLPPFLFQIWVGFKSPFRSGCVVHVKQKKSPIFIGWHFMFFVSRLLSANTNMCLILTYYTQLFILSHRQHSKSFLNEYFFNGLSWLQGNGIL